jgi:tRNA A37 threonylcarbamoyladenosine dehydratase/predicted adenine nucleotide alpha hydrolase (AANH) superfamily ATPase
MNVLLHCCCAPCSVSCVKNLRAENINFSLFWYNPNIHPFTEYRARRDCLAEFAANEKLELETADEYGLRSFISAVYPRKNERCLTCYRLRLEKTASFAAEKGFSAFSTSLLTSPYQDHEALRSIGGQMSAKYQIEFLYRDFRPLFRDGQSAAREKNLYMQKYCGCVFSEEERYLKNQKPPDGSHPVPHNFLERLQLLTGGTGLEKISQKRVLVFGAGGVGSWAAEALVRSGIGKIGIIDNDSICASNINRQIEATSFTVGQPKASALKKRLLEINPLCEITAWDALFCRENAHLFGIESADYVIDAIDSLNHKLDLIETVCKAGVTLFSSMGMALKMNPSLIKTAPIWKTSVCPLARLVRQGLKKRGFTGTFTAVYSGEEPIRGNLHQDCAPPPMQDAPQDRKAANGSIVTVTASAGFLLASLVLRDAIGDGLREKGNEQIF